MTDMRVLIDPGCYNLLNMGGVAMMQVSIGRVRSRWPEAAVAVLTDDPSLLVRHFPGVHPLLRRNLNQWLSDRYLLGPVHRLAPPPVSLQLLRWQQRLRAARPDWLHAATLFKMWLAHEDQRDFRAFLATVRDADVVVVSGAGGINDECSGYVREVATLLEGAVARGASSVMFGQGIGPLEDPILRARLGRTLPRVDLICVREARFGPGLLAGLGVCADRVVETGDDAIGIALTVPPAERRSLGVNLRVAPYTGVDAMTVAAVRPAIQDFAAKRGAPLLPVPIGLHQHAADHQVIEMLLAGAGGGDGGAGLDTPQLVLGQVARCRVVFTGAYHAAVFALGQGIPVVCLANSPLYTTKFAGLADAFGAGCTIVPVAEPNLVGRIDAALGAAWDAAPGLEAPLRHTAEQQAGRSRGAYEHFFSIVAGSRPRRGRERTLAEAS